MCCPKIGSSINCIPKKLHYPFDVQNMRCPKIEFSKNCVVQKLHCSKIALSKTAYVMVVKEVFRLGGSKLVLIVSHTVLAYRGPSPLRNFVILKLVLDSLGQLGNIL